MTEQQTANDAESGGSDLESAPVHPPPEPSDRPQASAGWHLDPTTLIVSLLGICSLVMVLWHLQDSSLTNANTGSRYATVESLVDYGTYHIDQSRYVRTIDKMKVGDNFISSKPPTLPTYAAGTYWLYQQVTGKTIRKHEGSVVWFVSLCTGWLAHLVFLITLYRLSRLLLQRQLAIVGVFAAGAFSYLGVGYATTINNHSIGATLMLLGMYYAFRIRLGKGRPWHWVASGLSLGYATAVDLPTGAMMFAALVYLGSHDVKRTLLWFAPALLPGLLTHLALNHLITGSFIPTYMNPELKDFAGNYFRERRSGIDALREPKPIYAFNVLLGHHGLFSMTPLFFFAAWEIGRSLWRRVRLAETLVVSFVAVAITGFFIFKSRNYGGWCVGMRHLVPVMVVLIPFFGLWLERIRLTKLSWGAVLVAFGIGTFHVQDALDSPFQFSRWHNWIDGTPNRGRVGKTLNVPKTKGDTAKIERASKTKTPKKPKSTKSESNVDRESNRAP